MALQPFSFQACSTALVAASLLAFKATRSKSLTRDGVVAGFTVGFLLVATGYRGFNLYLFYQLGSMATKVQQSSKQRLDATQAPATAEKSGKGGGQRSASQVFCVSILATLLSLWHAYSYGAEEPIEFENNAQPMKSQLTCAVLAHHATCLADTLASELGMVSWFKRGSSSIRRDNTAGVAKSSIAPPLSAPQQPILVTQPWRKVPVGTNGGITLIGTLWSAVGGAIIGCSTAIIDILAGTLPLYSSTITLMLIVVRMILFGTLCGLVGSFLDSVLGATLQATYWDTDRKQIIDGRTNDSSSSSSSQQHIQHICGYNLLSNEQVNFVSVILMTVLGGWVIGPLLFS